MKKNIYREHLDNIRCSNDFKERMEKMLSAESDGEYQEVVNHVEHAPKVNFQKWTAVAASAVLVFGICGVAFLQLGNVDSPPEYSEITDTEFEAPTEVQEAYKSEYTISLSVVGIFSKPSGHSMPFGNLPDKAVDEIIAEISNWSELDGVPSFANEPTGKLTLVIGGKESYTLQIDSNGEATIDRDGIETTHYYSPESYLAISRIIAENLPFCDWDVIVGSSDKKKRLSEAFANHIDEIELIDDFEPKLYMRFLSMGSFGGLIEKDGRFHIYYDNENSSVCFKASPEFYEDVYDCVHNDILDDISASTGMTCVYSQAQYGYNFTIRDVDLQPLYDAVKSLELTRCLDLEPPYSFYAIGTLEIAEDGTKIYDLSTSRTYLVEEGGETAIVNAIEEIINSSKQAKIANMIAKSERLTDTMEGDVWLYVTENVVDGNTGETAKYRLGGKGHMMCDVKNHSQYMEITKSEDGYNCEFIMNNGEWKLTESGGNIPDINKSCSEEANNERESNGNINIMNPYITYEFVKNQLFSVLTYGFYSEDVESEIFYQTENELTKGYVKQTIGNYNNTYNFVLDSRGNIIQFSSLSTDDNGETQENYYYLFGDSLGGGITYDNPELSIPTLESAYN